MLLVIFGAGQWVNGAGWAAYVLLAGLVVWLTVLYQWFSQAIGDSFRTFGFAMVRDFGIDPALGEGARRRQGGRPQRAAADDQAQRPGGSLLPLTVTAARFIQ